MQIDSAAFGPIAVNTDSLFKFIEGPIGLDTYKTFFIHDPKDGTPIKWLHNLDNESLCFPIISPHECIPHYEPKFSKFELENIGGNDPNVELETYLILTIPRDINDMTANAKAPVIVNMRDQVAKQVILSHSRYDVCEKVFTQLCA